MGNPTHCNDALFALDIPLVEVTTLGRRSFGTFAYFLLIELT
jgi:hypothetical protein